MSKIIVPVKSTEKLKFPLHKPVLLIMTSGKIYNCRIKFAGKDFIKVTDLQERIIDENNEVKYIDLQLPDVTIFSRDKINGYNPNITTNDTKKKQNKLISIKHRKG